MPGASGLALFETWGFEDHCGKTVRLDKLQFPGSPGLAPFETWAANVELKYRTSIFFPSAMIWSRRSRVGCS